MLAFWLFAGVVLLFGFVVFRGAPYVPSHRSDVRRAFSELYALDGKDFLVDVGSGDGVILRMASRLGAGAFGYELNPALVLLSRFISRKDKKVQVELADFWLAKLPKESTVVYAFIVERDVEKLSKKLQSEAGRLGHGFYVITYGSALKMPAKLRQVGAHHLYRFEPLHSKKPQV